jgi:hypothetical protein
MNQKMMKTMMTMGHILNQSKKKQKQEEKIF